MGRRKREKKEREKGKEEEEEWIEVNKKEGKKKPQNPEQGAGEGEGEKEGARRGAGAEEAAGGKSSLSILPVDEIEVGEREDGAKGKKKKKKKKKKKAIQASLTHTPTVKVTDIKVLVGESEGLADPKMIADVSQAIVLFLNNQFADAEAVFQENERVCFSFSFYFPPILSQTLSFIRNFSYRRSVMQRWVRQRFGLSVRL